MEKTRAISGIKNLRVDLLLKLYCQGVLPLNSLCFMPEFLSFACRLHPIKLVKTVRLRAREIAQLLAGAPELGLRVVLLVRDPRGVFNSRGGALVANWCTEEDCASPSNECRDLLEDFNTAKARQQDIDR